MSAEENIYELIDDYLNGNLSESDRAQFENRLKADQELANTFEAQKVAYTIVVEKELLGLRARISKDLDTNKTGQVNNAWKYITAGAVLVAALIAWLMLRSPEETPVKQSTPPLPLPADTIHYRPDTAHEQKDTTGKDTAITSDKVINPPATERVEKRRCQDTLISFSCQARATCAKEHNGAIEIDVNTIREGHGPFTFSTSAEAGFESGGTITNLKPGRYNVYVKDAGNCVRRLNIKVEVPEVSCD